MKTVVAQRAASTIGGLKSIGKNRRVEDEEEGTVKPRAKMTLVQIWGRVRVFGI